MSAWRLPPASRTRMRSGAACHENGSRRFSPPSRRFRLEHLRLIGWRLFAPAEYVNWCGHGQKVIPLPEEEGWCRHVLVPRRGEVKNQMTAPDASSEVLARSLVTCVFDLLHDCRAILPKLETPRARPESASAQAERVLYVALLGALEAGLVRTVEDALMVLRQASKPLGPMGDEWFKLHERLLRGDETQT